jgi:hypothetical protein
VKSQDSEPAGWSTVVYAVGAVVIIFLALTYMTERQFDAAGSAAGSAAAVILGLMVAIAGHIWDYLYVYGVVVFALLVLRLLALGVEALQDIARNPRVRR